MIRLGVNVDHVATLRQARGGAEPDPVRAAVLAELGGCHGITVHLREDRRHIQDRDLELLRRTVTTRLNLEMAVDDAVVAIACRVLPDQATLVPERRAELTTEGGLDAAGNLEGVREAACRLRDAGIAVSLFIDPDERQIDAAAAIGVSLVELHTGEFANAPDAARRRVRLDRLTAASRLANARGLTVLAGHGLTYLNVSAMHELDRCRELNIGHTICSRALFVGMERSVREMIALLKTPEDHPW